MAGKNKQKPGGMPRSTLVLMALVTVLAVILVAVSLMQLRPGAFSAPLSSVASTQPEASEATEAEAAINTTLAIPGNADATDIAGRGSYTVSAAEGKAAAPQVVAKLGDGELTNEMLQVYYLAAVSAHRGQADAAQPDYEAPLENQLCPLAENRSWQHYFLEQALCAWQTQQLLALDAQQPRPIREEAFKPNETDDLHGKYVAEDLPVNGFLYQDQDCYTPNSMHQSYLDELEPTLEALAKSAGYDSLQNYVNSCYGDAVSADAVIRMAEELNFAYMYLTECSYDLSLTSEDVEQFLSRQGIRNEGSFTVTLRHILLTPNGGKIAADGTVTATDDQWRSCKQEAENLLLTWERAYLTSLDREANFARTANASSQDEGSRLYGGKYTDIARGQLAGALDEWCFDPARKSGDTAVLRTELGYHVVYFCEKTPVVFTQAEDALAQEQLADKVAGLRSGESFQVDYPAIALWVDGSSSAFSYSDVLYPDVAHERFPEAIVYFQQDYMFSRYGDSYVGRGGCGITTMAMLATYMTDTVLTPDMLASRYGNYHDASGTRGELFRYTPEEMDFYLEKGTSKIEEVIEALENGQRVISLQYQGNFTSGGHYLLLQRYNEEDDTFQVRDSNIYNYARLKGHKIDKFTRWDVLSGGNVFYIMQKKVTRIPACARCGGTFDAHEPEKLLSSDYTCQRCHNALLRRDAFLSLLVQ